VGRLAVSHEGIGHAIEIISLDDRVALEAFGFHETSSAAMPFLDRLGATARRQRRLTVSVTSRGRDESISPCRRQLQGPKALENTPTPSGQAHA
jgi:hypothetical protein